MGETQEYKSMNLITLQGYDDTSSLLSSLEMINDEILQGELDDDMGLLGYVKSDADIYITLSGTNSILDMLTGVITPCLGAKKSKALQKQRAAIKAQIKQAADDPEKQAELKKALSIKNKAIKKAKKKESSKKKKGGLLSKIKKVGKKGLKGPMKLAKTAMKNPLMKKAILKSASMATGGAVDENMIKSGMKILSSKNKKKATAKAIKENPEQKDFLLATYEKNAEAEERVLDKAIPEGLDDKLDAVTVAYAKRYLDKGVLK